MKKITLIGLVVALMALFAGPAAAQDDGPTITADPVAAEGENEVTVNGAGFSPGIALFLLPCPSAEGDLEAVISEGGAALCDTANLTPVTAGDDGTFTVSNSFEVPADGLVIAVGDAASTEAAATLVTVGDGGGDAAADEDAAPAEEEAAPAADLANTGAETGVLVGVGVALLGLGVVSTRAGRRLGDR